MHAHGSRRQSKTEMHMVASCAHAQCAQEATTQCVPAQDKHSHTTQQSLTNPQLNLQIYLLCICYIPIVNKLENKNKEIAHLT